MAEISIIVPVYNVEAYLPLCIDSIRRQTFDDIEIVCVVDGSTDRSELLLRQYEKIDKRIRIVVKENGGLSSARNAGIEICDAPIVMFVDSDDMLVDNACEVVNDAFSKHDAEIVTFGAQCYPAAASNDWYETVLSPSNAYYSAFSADILFKEQSHPYVWRTAFKRDFFMRTKLRFDETVLFGEDQIFHFAAYPKANGVAFVPDKLYIYRLAREGSLMATRMSDEHLRLKEHITIVDHICSEWARDGLMGEYGSQLFTWSVDFLLFQITTSPSSCRDDLIARLSALFGGRFDNDEKLYANLSKEVRDLCVALAGGVESYSEVEKEAEAYLASIGYHQGQAGGRSKLVNNLRRVLPMSALALEERLNSIKSCNEMPEWRIADSTASVRSLEMLMLELHVNGFDQ